MTTSVKTYSGHNYEFGLGTNWTPLDALLSKEQFEAMSDTSRFMDSQRTKWCLLNSKVMDKWIATASSPATPSKEVNAMSNEVIERCLKNLKSSSFKYREAIEAMQKGDAEKGEEPAVTPDEMSSAAYAAILRLKEMERWKAEQVKVRRAQRHHERSETAKTLVDGKRQWNDATVYEFPPLVAHNGKGLKHVPAGYIMRLPNGTLVDLRKDNGPHKGCLRESPDQALQTIARRQGLKINGGASTIVQALVGLNDVVPAYTTIWNRNNWLVIVGWMRNPTIKLSTYAEGDEQELIHSKIITEGNVTHSKLEYAIISAPSIETHDEELDADECTLNLESGVCEDAIAADYRQVVDIDDVRTFDDNLHELYLFLKEHMDMSQFTAGSDDLQRNEVDIIIQTEYDEANQTQLKAFHHWEANQTDREANRAWDKAKKRAKKARYLWRTLIRARECHGDTLTITRASWGAMRGSSTTYGPFMPVGKLKQHPCGHGDMNPALDWSPAHACTTQMPDSEIEPQTREYQELGPNWVNVHPNQIPKQKIRLNGVKRGCDTILATANGLKRVHVPLAKPVLISARNAPPALKASLERMKRERLLAEFA